jgi:sulfite reductase (NADPH) hemoprotein beta-component
MYIYSEHDQKILEERVAQFRGQTARWQAGELSEEEFLPLRLQNGLYVQRHAPMLRVCVPYGNLNTQQLRKLAHIARTYDKGYCHISTRTNIQFNWPAIEKVPDILSELASVQMHAIQTSGNCIRNTTTDHFAGVAKDELEDPRPWCELIRQWSSFHPEFAYLPRKFKISVNATTEDRTASLINDIAVHLVKNTQGEIGFKVFVGGGLGRTPIVASPLCDFLPKEDLLSYLEAILRVYNRYGRRDNKYKARIKILVRALTPAVFKQQVEDEWEHFKNGPMKLTPKAIEDAASHFQDPDYESLPANDITLNEQLANNIAFAHWYRTNTTAHKTDGYRIVTLSMKKTAISPGDVTDQQLGAIADLADQYSFGEVRSTHDQNLVFTDVKLTDLYILWQSLTHLGFATANIGYITDITCCPGGDYCALANAKSIPIAEAIQRRFDNLDYLYDLGELELKISGCMNACGHHHIGHIGILGVDKKGKEFYQVSIGGSSRQKTHIGKILGPSFEQGDIVDVIEQLVQVYVKHRHEGESFLQTYERIGINVFKERVYAKNAA